MFHRWSRSSTTSHTFLCDLSTMLAGLEPGLRLDATAFDPVVGYAMFNAVTTSFAAVSHRDGAMRSAPRRMRVHRRRDARTSRIGQLLIGLASVGFGIGMIIQADLGVASWDVLNVGLAELTGLSVGVAAMMVGVGTTALAFVLGERPRIGSLVPLVVVAPSIDAALFLVGTPTGLPAQLALLFGGMTALATGIGAYIASDHGAGPSDLVFLAIARRGVPLSAARWIVDGCAVTAGWAIGGPIGLGTVVVTVGLGPMVGVALRVFDLVPARSAIADRDRAFDREQGLQLAWEIA